MNVLQPWQLLLVTLDGWINRQQQDVIAYIQEENRILRNKLKGKQIRFTTEFRRFLKQQGIKALRLAARSPNLNAHAERFVRSIKEGCLDRMIFFGEGSLHGAIRQFLVFYHHERNHQGFGNRLIDPLGVVGPLEGSVTCRERLGGMLRYYYRDAA